MTADSAPDHAGSSFEDFLREDGTLDQIDAVAVKRVLAWRLAEEMRARKVSKLAIARRMGTSRTQVDRLLDPENASVQLDTILRAARALDLRLSIRVDPVERTG
jgi:DNA-binding phage protein